MDSSPLTNFTGSNNLSPHTNFTYSPSQSPQLTSEQANSNSGPSLEYQNTRLTLPPAQNNIQQNVQHQHQNNNQPSFVDSSPYFNDLNASFKRLYKSIIINRDIYESEFNNKFQPPPMSNRLESALITDLKQEAFIPNTQNDRGPVMTNHNNLLQTDRRPEPTLNAINTNQSQSNTNQNFDFNQSFDNFVQNIRLASNGEVNWNLNDIDTTDFQDLVENMKSGDKNNWNMSSDQFVNFASSLSNFLAQSVRHKKNTLDSNDPQQLSNHENNVKLLKTELANINRSVKQEPNSQDQQNSMKHSNQHGSDLCVNINLNDSQLKLPMEIINNLSMSSSHLNMNNDHKFNNDSNEHMLIDNNYRLNPTNNNNHKPTNSFSVINNTFHNQMSTFSAFDNSGFMQSSFSSDNQSSPSTPLALNVMLNQQHHNSPSSPTINSLTNVNQPNNHNLTNHLRISNSQFNQIQQNNNQLINNSNKSNPLLNSRYNNESDEDDFIDWENLL